MEDYICSQIEESRIEFKEEMRELQQHTKSQFVEITGKLDAIIEMLPDWLRNNRIEPVDLIVVPSDQVTSDLVDDLLEVNRSLDSDLISEKVCVTTHSWIDSEVHMAKNAGSTYEEISEQKEVADVVLKVFDEMTVSNREALLEEHMYTKSDLLLDGIFGDVQPIEEQQAQGNDSSAFEIHENYHEKKICKVLPEMSMSCDKLSHIEVQKAGTLVSVTSVVENQKEKVAGPYTYHIFDEMTPLFRTNVMNIRGINFNKNTLFDPGGDIKYALSCVDGVKGSASLDHSTVASGNEYCLFVCYHSHRFKNDSLAIFEESATGFYVVSSQNANVDIAHKVLDKRLQSFEATLIEEHVIDPYKGISQANGRHKDDVMFLCHLGGYCLFYEGCENFEFNHCCLDERNQRIQSWTTIIGSHKCNINGVMFTVFIASSALLSCVAWHNTDFVAPITPSVFCAKVIQQHRFSTKVYSITTLLKDWDSLQKRVDRVVIIQDQDAISFYIIEGNDVLKRKEICIQLACALKQHDVKLSMSAMQMAQKLQLVEYGGYLYNHGSYTIMASKNIYHANFYPSSNVTYTNVLQGDENGDVLNRAALGMRLQIRNEDSGGCWVLVNLKGFVWDPGLHMSMEEESDNQHLVFWFSEKVPCVCPTSALVLALFLVSCDSYSMWHCCNMAMMNRVVGSIEMASLHYLDGTIDIGDGNVLATIYHSFEFYIVVTVKSMVLVNLKRFVWDPGKDLYGICKPCKAESLVAFGKYIDMEVTTSTIIAFVTKAVRFGVASLELGGVLLTVLCEERSIAML